MKMLSLIKIELLGFLNFNKALKGNNKDKAKLSAVIAFGLIIFGFLAGSFLFYSLNLASKIRAEGLNDYSLIVKIAFLFVNVLILIFTTFRTNGFLFGSKDYEILASFPISKTKIILSKLICVYLYDVLYSFALLIPSGIVFFIFQGINPFLFAPYILMVLIVPMIPVLISQIIGTLLCLIIAKTGNSYISNMFMTLIFIGIWALYFFFFRLDITEIHMTIDQVAMINKYYPLIDLFGKAITFSDFSCLIFILLSVLSLGISSFFIGLLYKTINQMLLNKRTKGNYKMTKLKQNGKIRALYRKEIRKAIKTPLFLINNCLGAILALIAGIAALVMAPQLFESLKENSISMSSIEKFFPLVALVYPLLIFISPLTSVMISLEGKTVGLLKSLPIKTIDIFKSKIAVALTLILPPCFISAICVIIALKINDPIVIILIFLSIIASALISTVLYLLINVIIPMYDWKTETQCIKQSMSALVCTMIGIVLPVVMSIIVIILPIDKRILIAITDIIFFILFGLSAYLLKTIGVKKFKEE